MWGQLDTHLEKKDVVHIYNGILTDIKRMNSAICDNMDGPRWYRVKWNKSDKNKYDLTYMWNLKNKINEQTKQKQTHRTF